MQQAPSKNTGSESATGLLGGYRNRDIFGIFRFDSAEAKDEAIILAPRDLEAFLEGAGIDPRLTRYQVEFMTPENPFNAGFYRLLGIRILSEESMLSETASGNGETTVIDFIGQFMASQKKELEIEKGCDILYPIAMKEGGLLVIAASQPEIFAISAS